MLIMIAYDLHPAAGRDYAPIEDAIKSYAIWAHPEGSVWVIDTLEQPKAVVEKLMAVGLPQDTFFAARLQANWWSRGLTGPVVEWLKDPSRRW